MNASQAAPAASAASLRGRPTMESGTRTVTIRVE